MLGGAAFFAGADLALLDASGAEDVIGGFLELLAGDELALSVVARARDAEPNAIAAVWKRSITADLFRGGQEVSDGKSRLRRDSFGRGETKAAGVREAAGNAGARKPYLSGATDEAS